MREAYQRWLDQQEYMKGTKSNQWSQAGRIERLYGDLDAAYDRDRFASILSELKYSKEDERAARPNPSKIDIDGDLYSNLATYRATLSYFRQFRESEAQPMAPHPLKREELERLKQIFLARYPDFDGLGFEADHGSYWDDERGYKEEVLEGARAILARAGASPQETGEAFLKLLQRPPANFVGWRAFAQIKDAGPDVERGVAIALGEMLISQDEVTSLAASCAARIHPLIMGGTLGNPAYGQVRTLVTTALALARPDEAIAVKTQYMQRAAKALDGHGPFKREVMTSAEYDEVLMLAESIRTAMQEEWRWTPRDLWDVQGFLWATSDAQNEDDPQENGEPMDDASAPNSPPQPTNLILYGPPGTGKTYKTAEKAVEICDGHAPAGGRAAVMGRYNELVTSGRISFVTFHQSYAYEDFVEGLRPVTEGPSEVPQPSESGGETAATPSGGFSLKPHAGVFKRIATLADANRGRALAPPTLDPTRRVFKMSLGRSWSDEGARMFKAALAGNYVSLGWGRDIDWSAPQFDSFPAVKARWQQDHPEATGYDSNIKQLWVLRGGMQIGDLVIISDGNEKFRAIGRISGPYQFVFDEVDEYHHRRPVQWLWWSDKGLPRDLIYGRGFTMAAAYQLDSSQLNWPALEQIVASGGEGAKPRGAPEPFVLIIDEINRANISKVFGELITLLEPDKRLGAENALTVTLPYSLEPFGVPSNLHVIGTMNTADRSIALLDTALRRRFDFAELMPNPDMLEVASSATGIDLVSALKGLNERIEYLFDRDHQIGHGFFMGCVSTSAVDQVMRNKVIPLLVEYFYENWEKVRQALGETSDTGAFVGRVPLKAPKGAEAFAPDDGRWRYFVQPDFTPAAYDQLKS